MKCLNFVKLCAAAALLLAQLCAAIGAEEFFGLFNGKAEIKFDSAGNLVSLKNLEKNREYAGGRGIWRIIYRDGDLLEEALESSDVPVEVSKKDGGIFLSYGGEFPVEIMCRLDGDSVVFSPKISNASKGKILSEFHFPMIESANIRENTVLYLPVAGGTYFPDVRGWLMSGFKSYMAQDNKAIEQYATYPCPLSMNYYVFDDGDCALYVGSHDPSFEKTLHIFRARHSGGSGDFNYGGVDFGMVKFPFLKPGQSKALAGYVVSPHSGDWHVSAKKYRKWADTWFSHKEPAESYKSSNGWQRIILRHQYGKTFYRYDQLPEIREAGRGAGLDTLMLFGWWKEGMDAGYPEYTPDAAQGGDEALKKWIKEFQKDGGKVIVYFNGQLIDTGTAFYREIGRKISVKRSDGAEHIERYPFGGDGTALREFGNKTFVTACPASEIWRGILRKFIDRAAALEADGVFFDQLGYKSEVCFDPSHGHAVPSFDIMRVKSEMVREMRDYVKSKNPKMSFGIEWFSDITAQHADYVHTTMPNLHLQRSQALSQARLSVVMPNMSTGGGGGKSAVPRTAHAPMFKYTFPEIQMTNRDIYDNRDVAGRLNRTFMRGWREDAGVFRCRATVDAAPVYKAYLAKIARLRDKYRPLALNGVFRDTDLAECSDADIEYSTFENGEEIAVAATQSHARSASARFKVGGAKFEKSDGIGDFKVEAKGSSASVRIGKDALVLLVFKKK